MHQEYLDTKPLTTSLGAILAKMNVKDEPKKPEPKEKPRRHRISLGTKHNLLEGRVNSQALLLDKIAKRIDQFTEYLRKHRDWSEGNLEEMKKKIDAQEKRIDELEKKLKKMSRTEVTSNLVGILLRK